jgi:8-oxo-dGTP pyrophosphatase MutT (NUDIX family)
MGKIRADCGLMAMKHIHPKPDDNGNAITIHRPSQPSSLEAFADPEQVAVVVPEGETPAAVNGIPLAAWSTAPASPLQWAKVAGQIDIDEPPMEPKPGKKLSAGVVTVEPDGRFWLVAPTNAFGGYKATFPKGRLEPGMTPQATAIKEAYEEAGLQVQIIAYIGDFERTTTLTRYYLGRRIGGLPAEMHWESQAVMLVPRSQLLNVLNHPNDHAVLAALDKLKLID